ncbi:MAG TPA: tetratricopeptide repeat protein [Thermoanaerobaculia bacterium]|nr:tetratricopeptide repeat protein [Thermoanaerobaculia bacterium]
MRGKFWQALGMAALLLAPVLAAAAADALAPGIQLYDGRRYEEARKFFEPWAAKNPKDAEAAFYLGRTLLGLRKSEPAAEWLEKATALAPRRSDYFLWLGRAYGQAALEANVLRQPGLAKKTRAAWEKAVALDPANLDARDSLITFYLEAPGIMGGSVDKAKEQAAEIRKRDAVRGRLALVNIAFDQKDMATAERELKAAIQEAPADSRPRVSLSLFYQSQEKWGAAFDTLENLLKADPDNYDALYQIGRAAALSGQRPDRGEECLKRYLGHPPGPQSAPLANAHFRLGQVYEKKGSKPQARAEYQAALKLDPSLKEAKAALAKL